MRNTATTLLAASLLLVSSSFGATASSEPLGFTNQTITPGQQTVGITLNNPVIESAMILANNSASLALDASPSQISQIFAADRSYYVEIVADLVDTFAGDRFDIDVAATRSAGGATLHLKDAAHNSTSLPLPKDVLNGHRVIIREHLTIAQVFGTGYDTAFQSAARFEKADQLLFFNRVSGGFASYYLCSNDADMRAEWRLAGAMGNQDNAIIPPGTGLFVQRNGSTSVELTILGAVRTNDFVMPLSSGYNFIASPYPVAATPAALEMSAVNGFAASAEAADADQILAFNGSAFDVYFLHRSNAGSQDEWRKQGGGSESFTTAELLAHSRSVFVKKVGSDPDYVARRSFSL